MDRWLGDGGMALLAALAAALQGLRGGRGGPRLGRRAFTPRALACNPHGIIQAGVHAPVLDACMNFAINAALPGRTGPGGRSR